MGVILRRRPCFFGGQIGRPVPGGNGSSGLAPAQLLDAPRHIASCRALLEIPAVLVNVGHIAGMRDDEQTSRFIRQDAS
jgi:hypothetical protein